MAHSLRTDSSDSARAPPPTPGGRIRRSHVTMKTRLRRHALAGVCLCLWAGTSLGAVEETWVYAVRVTAAVQASPARIELSWPSDSHPVSGYTVFRKAPGETA